jgi:hypothetical protein
MVLGQFLGVLGDYSEAMEDAIGCWRTVEDGGI